MTLPADLHARMRELREREGLSFAAIAERLGLGPSTVWRIAVRDGWSGSRPRRSERQSENPERDAKVRELWSVVPRLTCKELGERLGVSRNVVVGLAHRMGLPPRPSPIVRTGKVRGSWRQPAPYRQDGAVALAEARLVSRQPERPKLAPTPIVAPARAMSAPNGPALPCCWPIGDPGTPGFRFCDAVAEHWKPYCAEHVRLAYVRRTERAA